jgi:hypothetical protein
MDAKENLLRAIRREAPEYVPWSVPREYPEFRHLDEGVIKVISVAGNAPGFGQELVDNWGIHWVPVGGEHMYPHARSHPLADLDDLDGYRFPDPSKIELREASQELWETVDGRYPLRLV